MEGEVGSKLEASVGIMNAEVEAAITSGYELEIRDGTSRSKSMELSVKPDSSTEYVIKWTPVVWSGSLPFTFQSGERRIAYLYEKIAFGEVIDIIDKTEEDCGSVTRPTSEAAPTIYPGSAITDTPMPLSIRRATSTTIPGWEDRQKDYFVGEPMPFLFDLSAGGFERHSVSFILNLTDNDPYSLSERALISNVEPLMYCSTIFKENNTCQEPSPENDTEIVNGSWVRTNDIIIWTLPFLLPSDKTVSGRIEFVAKPKDVKDGDLIHVSIIATYLDEPPNDDELQTIHFPEELYVVREQ